MAEPRDRARPSPASGSASLWIAVAGVAVAVISQWPLLADPLALHDDARAVVVRAALWEAPGTFDADPFARYAALYVPPALEAIYRLLAPILPAAWVTKLMAIPITVACGLCVWSAGRRKGGDAAGGLAAVLFLLFLWSSWPPVLGAGDAGDFFPLFLCLFVWLVPGHSRLALACLFVAEALVYPPALMLCGGAWILSEAWDARSMRWALRGPPTCRRSIALLAVLLLACLAGAAVPYWIRPAAHLGQPVTLAESRRMPQFGPGGRIPLHGEGLVASLVNERSGLAIDPPRIVLAALAALAFALGRRQRRVGLTAMQGALGPAIALLASGLVLFLASRTFVFLYQPSRFVILTVPLWLSLAAGSHAGGALVRLSRPALGRAILAAALAALFAAALPRLHGNLVRPADPGLVRYLASLSPSILVAGPPLEMDNVMAFARRRVFASNEFSLPFYRGWAEETGRAMSAFLAAYYAQDTVEVVEFCEANEVTHLAVARADFPPAMDGGEPGDGEVSRPLYHEPFLSEAKRIVAGRSDFALPAVPPARRLYESPWGFVLDCSPAGLASS